MTLKLILWVITIIISYFIVRPILNKLSSDDKKRIPVTPIILILLSPYVNVIFSLLMANMLYDKENLSRIFELKDKKTK